MPAPNHQHRLDILLSNVGPNVRAELRCQPQDVQQDPEKALGVKREVFGTRCCRIHQSPEQAFRQVREQAICWSDDEEDSVDIAPVTAILLWPLRPPAEDGSKLEATLTSILGKMERFLARQTSYRPNNPSDDEGRRLFYCIRKLGTLSITVRIAKKKNSLLRRHWGGVGAQYLLEEGSGANTKGGCQDSRQRSDGSGGYRIPSTTVTEDLVRWWHYSSAQPLPLSSFKLTAANGLDIPMSGYLVADVMVNGQVVENAVVMVLKDQPGKGATCLLGMNVLQHIPGPGNIFPSRSQV
ncbi:hypothetical protein PoB_005100400 [Plakobranchus ocellatus]|uniref:Uncharacterized protein n=1 Tax=Plakobranchus ocellatus TaxID=259542 RepID=A0AAV4BWB2_9GAST|nr:hypothetical protein PoB_005100400 [Plakobranchus ocellatus]